MNSQEVKQKIIASGLHPSLQRIRILEHLYAHEGHFTADEIFAALVGEMPTLSKATVYNTLNTFVQAGLVRMLSLDEHEQRFDVITHTHGHFKCKSCSTIINFPIDIDSLHIKTLEAFQVNEKEIYFYGLCPNCIAQQTTKEKI